MSIAEVGSNRFTNATIRAIPSEPDSPTFLMPSFPRTPDYSLAPAKRSRCACGARVDPAVGIYCSIDCARGDAFSSLTHTRQGSSSSLGYAFGESATSRASSINSDLDEGSHYRRIKREQRREMELMRRGDSTGEGSLSPESTRSPSAVPDLVSSHSRNTSTASSIFSLSSCASLSRNPSTSSHGAAYTSSVVIDDAIMEDDSEILHDIASARSTLKACRRVEKELPRSNLMVNDMLDEIINMEESFHVPDEQQQQPRGRSRSRTPSTPDRMEFVPSVFRAPRTPSPASRRRGSVIPPAAPGGPNRRRSSLVHDRPPSLYAHQSSLSESHTALYLATASPVSKNNNRHRRSASPKLSVRRSLSFTPTAAGPAISRHRFDSPGLTPVRRKHLTPNAHHPPMQGWRFPTASNSTTPTRGDYASLAPEPSTPIEPQQLWPRPARTSSLSEAPGIPPAPGSNAFSPPSSAVRLGILMNSDSDFDDDASTVRGSIRQSFAAPVAPFTRPGW